MAVQRLTVGIFSRDGQENYKWLVNLLRASMFQSLVDYVLNVYITNNSQTFTDALTQCSFAILYHTKRRGRLNIANVTDSLYDKELRDMNDVLGDNVVVLVDDVEDSSDDFKRRILHEQPLIRECARELILISELEKQSANMTGSDPRWSPAPITQTMQDAYDSIHNKIYRIRNFMEEAVGDSPDHRRRNAADSDSDTQSEGYKSSASTKPATYTQRDEGSVRNSSAYSSDRSSRPLFNSQRSSRGGLLAIHEEAHVLPDGDGQIPTGGKRNLFYRCKNLSDKTVFFIIGGLVAVLLIILIVILSVAL